MLKQEIEKPKCKDCRHWIREYDEPPYVGCWKGHCSNKREYGNHPWIRDENNHCIYSESFEPKEK